MPGPGIDYERWAHLYDDLVVSDEDVAFFVELARAARGGVLELMAGTGRVSLPLAAAGVELTCVDRSAAMLEILRGRLAAADLSAAVVEQDVAALDLGERFALVFIAFNSFEELVDDAVRERALAAIREHLAPAGRAVVTLHDPAAAGDPPPAERELATTFVERSTGRPVRFRHSARRAGEVWSGVQSFAYEDSGEEIASTPVRYRQIGKEEFERLAERAGLEVEALYGDCRRSPWVAGESDQTIWMLRRGGGAASPSHGRAADD